MNGVAEAAATTRLHRWCLLLLLFPVSAEAQAALPLAGLAACDAQAGTNPDDPGGTLCYLALAGSGRVPLDTVATHLRDRLKGKPGDPHVQRALGVVRAMGGHPDAAALFQAAATTYARESNPAGEVLARVGLASFLMRTGSTLDAAHSLSAATTVADRSRRPVLVAWVRTTQAWLDYRELNYGRALRLLTSVKDTVTTGRDRRLLSEWRAAMGANLWALGRSSEALAQYEAQAAALAEEGNRFEEASARVNIVLLTGGPRRRTRAFEAARIARESGNLSAESSAYFHLSGTSPPEEAREHARRSLALAVASRSPVDISRAKGALSLFTLPFDESEAFRLIDEAVGEARNVGDSNQAVRHRFTRSTMRWQTGPREQAIADSQELIESIEALRGYQPEDDVRAERFAQWRFAYYRLAGHLLAGHLAQDPSPGQDESELAFATVERMRARMLLDRLDAAGASLPAAGNPLRAVRNEILVKIAERNRWLGRLPAGSADRRTTLTELQSLESEAAEASAQLARADPAFGDLHLPRLATLAEVRAALAPDEALISFQIASLRQGNGPPFGAWVWTVTPTEVRALPLEDPQNMASAVDLFLGLIERRDGSEATAASRLFADLLAPALKSLRSPVSKLIIIPDDTLHRLPFDALRETPVAPPLATKYQMTLAPSASVWLRGRQNGMASAPAAAMVLADPLLPGYAGKSADDGAVGKGLWPLPEARREGRALVRAVRGGSRLHSGEDATEALVKNRRLAEFGILHFATHALIDDQHPERSAVLLSPGGPSNDDGYLQVREIIDLPLSGQLVLLSACRSAAGAVVPGEGALGLAHAFFRAGARTVVANLWPIRDDDAGEAFGLISQALGRGESVSAAVTAARRALADRGAPAAAWAGLIVMGDGELVPLPGGRRPLPPWWMVASFACGALAFAAWTVRARAAAAAGA